MKKLLLICPHFMGYDEVLIEALSQNFEVFYIDTEILLRKVRQEYNQLFPCLRILFKLFNYLREVYREIMLEKNQDIINKQLNNNNVDFVIVINGDGVPNSFYEYLKFVNKGIKLYLFIWDDYTWLFKKHHLKYFHKIASYNIADCKKFGFIYLPVFTKNIIHKYPVKKKYDIAIIATANKERVQLSRKIYEKYKKIFNFYIYFYDKNGDFDFFSYKTPLSYVEYMTKIAESRAVLEIVRNNQKGPTTRIFDSLEAQTKIITTNHNISKYPVYNENILIINRKCNIPEKFIISDFKKIEFSSLSIDAWISELLK